MSKNPGLAWSKILSNFIASKFLIIKCITSCCTRVSTRVYLLLRNNESKTHVHVYVVYLQSYKEKTPNQVFIQWTK